MVHLIKNKMNPDKELLINMELDNGLHTTFIVLIKNNSFTYKGKSYIIENEFKYFNLNASLWCLDYHESFVCPIQRKINITEIKRQVIGKGITDIDRAINPLTLEQFIESQVIEKVMKGQALDELMRFLKIMSIITVVIALIHFGMFLKASGILDNINIGV